jgi:hypothetical protein
MDSSEDLAIVVVAAADEGRLTRRKRVVDLRAVGDRLRRKVDATTPRVPAGRTDSLALQHSVHLSSQPILLLEFE